MLLLLIAAQASAVDAERAFAADAQKLGQWTAFRKWAAEDAIMFWPEPVRAQVILKLRKDPPAAVRWSPAESYVSCDESMAANTGPTRWPDGRTGYFWTFWARQPTGDWKWTIDNGDAPATTRWRLGAAPVTRRAACTGKPTSPPEIQFRSAPKATGKRVSPDGTLAYFWSINAADTWSLHVWLWSGSAWDEVIHNSVPAPTP